MRVALDTKWAPFVTGPSTEPRGFAVDLGAFIAGEMGMATEFVAASSPDEVADLVNDGDADLGLAAFELTEEQVRTNSLTDPFFIAHQRLLVPAGSGIEDVDGLEGRAVCQVVDEVTGVSIEGQVGSAEVTTQDDVQQCVEELERGEIDAVYAPDGRLLRWLAPDRGSDVDLELVGDESTTVGWGAIASPELSGLVGHFNDSLTEAKSDGDWSEWYGRWIEPLTGERDAEPPGLSLEEAAALYPSSV